MCLFIFIFILFYIFFCVISLWLLWLINSFILFNIQFVLFNVKEFQRGFLRMETLYCHLELKMLSCYLYTNKCYLTNYINNFHFANNKATTRKIPKKKYKKLKWFIHFYTQQKTAYKTLRRSRVNKKIAEIQHKQPRRSETRVCEKHRKRQTRNFSSRM